MACYAELSVGVVHEPQTGVGCKAERKCSKPPCIAGRLSLCGQRGFMDKLQKCAKAFENLLEIQYRIIIGRKGKTAELVIGFSKLDFHHLMGLGKLKDLRIAKQNRGSVFDEIITGIMTSMRIASNSPEALFSKASSAS